VKLRSLHFGTLLLMLAALPTGAGAAGLGSISGLVVDPSGTPQMGASVLISGEALVAAAPEELLTNVSGRFLSDTLRPGLYTIRVTLAGFLPAIQQHIMVTGDHTTLLQIGVGSLLSSFEGLRKQPKQPVASDEWAWVLRSSTGTRTVLRFDDTGVVIADYPTGRDVAMAEQPRGEVEVTDGARHPGSISNLADSPGTEFGYLDRLESGDKLLFAGQFSYEDFASTGGLATEWLPQGDPGTVTSVVMRESRVGPLGPMFRGLRVDHERQFAVGDRVFAKYGAEYLSASFQGTTNALRPYGAVMVQVSPNWQTTFTVSSRTPQESGLSELGTVESAIDSLDAFPTLLVNHGRSVLENNLHEEFAAERSLGGKSGLQAAVFHDRSEHTAVFGQGGNAASSDFLQDFFSDAFAYDAGASSSWGARVAYHQKISDNLDAALIYAWAGALAPDASPTGSAVAELRDSLATRYRQSVAGRLSARVPRTKTQFSVSYKYIDGTTVSRQDAYGESYFRVDPNLNLIVRQALPGHLEAVCDFGNLLDQGYVPVASTRDGVVLLVPSTRSVRGSLSFQF
jgi:carboxypeptidase family protein